MEFKVINSMMSDRIVIRKKQVYFSVWVCPYVHHNKAMLKNQKRSEGPRFTALFERQKEKKRYVTRKFVFIFHRVLKCNSLKVTNRSKIFSVQLVACFSLGGSIKPLHNISP